VLTAAGRGEVTSERDAVCLPCLSGDASEEFIRLSFVHAKKKILQLQAEKEAAERRIQLLQEKLVMRKSGELATLQAEESETNAVGEVVIESETSVSGKESARNHADHEGSTGGSTHDSTSDDDSWNEELDNAAEASVQQAPSLPRPGRHEAWI